MTTHDPFTDLLSDYLDDEDLSAAERSRIEMHLSGCPACRETLAELREVVSRAASLPDAPPSTDLWPGVAGRIGPAAADRTSLFRKWGVRRSFTFTFPQLVAASLALMVVSGAAVWLVRFGGPHTDFVPIAALEAPTGSDIEITRTNLADAHYDQAIADLEKALEEGRSRLDSETVRVLEENLRAIDRAIDQCRSALASDPANMYLSSHLASARKRKLALLRRAAALVGSEG
jgi:tetratricopeptide (TPR) repeat protein